MGNSALFKKKFNLKPSVNKRMCDLLWKRNLKQFFESQDLGNS